MEKQIGGQRHKSQHEHNKRAWQHLQPNSSEGIWEVATWHLSQKSPFNFYLVIVANAGSTNVTPDQRYLELKRNQLQMLELHK